MSLIGSKPKKTPKRRKTKGARRRLKSLFQLQFMEAEVGIEPASTALQAVCCLIVQWLTSNATRSATRRVLKCYATTRNLPLSIVFSDLIALAAADLAPGYP